MLGDLAGRPDEGTRLSRMRARAVATAERATTWGPLAPFAELGWRVYRRDQSIAGSVLASALAYRLFIWVLPLMLVLVGGLGLARPGEGEAAAALDDAGLGSVVAQSVGDAADATSLWARIALVIGGSMVLIYETYVLLRALRAASAFAWRIPVSPIRRPVHHTLILLALILGSFAAGSFTRAIADAVGPPLGWVVGVAVLVLWPAAFIVLSVVLLPGPRGIVAHLPGAALFTVLMAGIHLFNVLILIPWIARKQETYGALGLAAGVLLALFVAARALIASAALNAVVQEDRHPPATPG